MNTRSWFWLCCLSLAVMAASVVLPACSGPKPEAPKAVETPTPQDGAVQPPLAAPIDLGLNVGDVEAGVIVAATVPPEAISGQVSVENMETRRELLAMATVTVRPPYPEKLNIQVTLTPKVSFEKQPVVVRGRMRRDEQPIEPEFSAIVSEGGPLKKTVLKCEFDVMQGLAAPPETMLVHARFDAYLMPMNTPVTGLDPKTATSDQHTELLSNPVRINFVK